MDYDLIELRFSEIRAIPIPGGGHRLVYCDGTEYQYRWRTREWIVTLHNPDPRTLDPSEFSLHIAANPGASPATQSANTEAHTTDTELPSLLSRISDSLTPETEEETAVDLQIPEVRFPECWCGIDVCSCPLFRLDTPPTPENIVLWHPGAQYLPHH